MNRGEIKGVLLDWDDTGMNSFVGVHGVYSQFAAGRNLPQVTREDLRGQWGKPLVKILQGLWPQQYYPGMDEDFHESVPEDFAVEPFPWFAPAIKTLSESGYRLGVVSSTVRKGLEKTVAVYRMDMSPFCHVQAGEDCEHHKPDPRVFDPAMKKLEEMGVAEQETIYVGDSLGDMAAAVARGLLFVAVTTGFTTREDFTGAGQAEDRILDHFGHLPAWLKKK